MTLYEHAKKVQQIRDKALDNKEFDVLRFWTPVFVEILDKIEARDGKINYELINKG